MLVIYNENNSNWTRANINDKTSKFTVSRTLKDGNVRYLDILVSNDIETPDMGEFVNMSDCKVINPGNTVIKFKRKDLKPFISTSDKFNNDIVLINVMLNGKIIKNISGDKVSVIGYLIAKGELFLVMSVRDTEGKASFEITLHDANLIADTVYTFTKNDNEYHVNREDMQVETAIEKPSFKINYYRPNKPTHAIFVKEDEKGNLVKNLKHVNNHNIITFNGSNLGTSIENMRKDGYKAVTLFVNNSEFAGNNDNTYGKIYSDLKSNFKIVNILLNDGKVHQK